MLSAQDLAQFVAVRQNERSLSWDMNFDALDKCWSGLRTVIILSRLFVYEKVKCEHCVFYITNEMQLIQCSLLLSALYMFRTVFPSIIRSL